MKDTDSDQARVVQTPLVRELCSAQLETPMKPRDGFHRSCAAPRLHHEDGFLPMKIRSAIKPKSEKQRDRSENRQDNITSRRVDGIR